MRLVEAVLGELLDVLPDAFRLGRRDFVRFGAALDELVVLGLHVLDLLLADGAAEDVGLAERESGEHLHALHDLFLIEHDAVRFLQVLFHEGMVVFERDGAFFASDEEVEELHRAGAVERHESDDVPEILDAELAAEILHAAGFELEHGNGVAAVDEVVGLLVVQRDRVHVERDAVRALHVGGGRGSPF